jgi:hypothetical protein
MGDVTGDVTGDACRRRWRAGLQTLQIEVWGDVRLVLWCVCVNLGFRSSKIELINLALQV